MDWSHIARGKAIHWCSEPVWSSWNAVDDFIFLLENISDHINNIVCIRIDYKHIQLFIAIAAEFFG